MVPNLKRFVPALIVSSFLGLIACTDQSEVAAYLRGLRDDEITALLDRASESCGRCQELTPVTEPAGMAWTEISNLELEAAIKQSGMRIALRQCSDATHRVVVYRNQREYCLKLQEAQDADFGRVRVWVLQEFSKRSLPIGDPTGDLKDFFYKSDELQKLYFYIAKQTIKGDFSNHLVEIAHLKVIEQKDLSTVHKKHEIENPPAPRPAPAPSPAPALSAPTGAPAPSGAAGPSTPANPPAPAAPPASPEPAVPAPSGIVAPSGH